VVMSVEKCVDSRFEEKREKLTKFLATSYVNQPRLFWRSDHETLSDWAEIFIGDYPLIVLQFEWWDCPMNSYRSTTNFMKYYYNNKFLLQPVSIFSEIQQWNLFPITQCFILDGSIWNQSSGLFAENSWTVTIFMVMRFLNFFLLNFLLVF